MKRSPMRLLRRSRGENGRARGVVRDGAGVFRARSWSRPAAAALLATVLVAGGCATGGKTGAESGASARRARIKLAVLPVESDAHHARLATALNEQLSDVKVAGVDDYFVSKVTLEVIQLSIECVEQSVECYAAVGRSLAANHLLFGTIVLGTRKRDKSVKVVLSLFDVASASFTQTAEHLYKNTDEALRGASELVARLSQPAGGGTRAAAVESRR